MSRGKDLLLLLLLLAEHVLLGGCQTPTVSITPSFTEIYAGDRFFLDCGIKGNDEVKLFHNNENVPEFRDGRLKVPVAARRHSGNYHCENNGVKSESLSINVHGYRPRASLILETGQPVTRPGSSVILRLENDEGLDGWRCFVLREQEISKIMLPNVNNSVSLSFQPRGLKTPEAIYWCTNKAQSQRSNQVLIRTSDKDVSMEMHFAPVVVGEPLTLRCLHWGMEKISLVSFYKNNQPLVENSNHVTHEIDSVMESDQGGYKCLATFTNKSPQTSDVQQLLIQEEVERAVVTEFWGMTCSCPSCPGIARYVWYKITDDSEPLRLPGEARLMTPGEHGHYACAAMWPSGRTLLSRSYQYHPKPWIPVIIILCLLVLIAGVLYVVYWFRKQNRRTTGPLYEDVMLKSKEDDRYERLQRRGSQKESEYSTIQTTEGGNAKREGDYQPLATGGMTEGVYHTLGTEGEGSGAAVGGYEALQKKSMKEAIYHSVGAKVAESEEQN